MAKRLYVGNLPFSATPEQLQELFEPFGPVRSVQVMNDRETGRSRGFGFVEMEVDSAALKAIQTLDGTEHLGRRLNVNEASPKVPNVGGPRAGSGPRGGFPGGGPGERSGEYGGRY